MTFYAAIGYKFAIPEAVKPHGSVLLCGAMPLHQLVRRKVNSKQKTHPKAVKNSHLASLLFDPQLYLAELPVSQAAKACAKLATYGWFGTPVDASYDSKVQTQKEWMTVALRTIGERWPGRAPGTSQAICDAVRECVEVQIALGVEAIVLPSPLSHDPSSAYETELQWLDEGVAYARSATDKPVLATLALADICLRYAPPDQNAFIDLVADAISAREVDGVYLVVEQGSEAADGRQCTNSRVLASVLHLVHLFSHDSGLRVVANFLGAFGAVCRVAGADTWGCGWYKSLHRLRLADQGAPGRAYPTYWSTPGAIDVNLDVDFDTLVKANLLSSIKDLSSASKPLLDAAARGVKAAKVPAWAYLQSNVTACTEHFFLAALALDDWLDGLPAEQRAAAMENWLANAERIAASCADQLGRTAKTRTSHVKPWLDAVRAYRRIHRA